MGEEEGCVGSTLAVVYLKDDGTEYRDLVRGETWAGSSESLSVLLTGGIFDRGDGVERCFQVRRAASADNR